MSVLPAARRIGAKYNTLRLGRVKRQTTAAVANEERLGVSRPGNLAAQSVCAANAIPGEKAVVW